MGCLRFARYCGKIYSRHLFPTGDWKQTNRVLYTVKTWLGMSLREGFESRQHSPLLMKSKYPTKGTGRFNDIHWIKSLRHGLHMYVRHQMIWFLAVFARKRVSILTILVSNSIWFLHSSLELSTCYSRSYFFTIIHNTINKSPSQTFNIGMNQGTNYKAGLKKGGQVLQRVSNF